MNKQDLNNNSNMGLEGRFSNKIDKKLIPEYVQNIVIELQNAGFSAYLVGGCVRDLILKRTPKDWDVTTSAKPEEIMGVFQDAFYENSFGTVGVKIRKTGGNDGAEGEMEVQTEEYW